MPSGELAFAGEGVELPTLDEHVNYLFEQKKAYHKNLVLIQRQIRNANWLLKQISHCGQWHGSIFDRFAKMTTRNLEGMEEILDGWRDSLHGYDDMVHRHRGLMQEYCKMHAELQELRQAAGAVGNPPAAAAAAAGESPLIPRGLSGFSSEGETGPDVDNDDDDSTAIMLTPMKSKNGNDGISGSPDY